MPRLLAGQRQQFKHRSSRKPHKRNDCKFDMVMHGRGGTWCNIGV